MQIMFDSISMTCTFLLQLLAMCDDSSVLNKIIFVQDMADCLALADCIVVI
jgi:hypothetical protein